MYIMYVLFIHSGSRPPTIVVALNPGLRSGIGHWGVAGIL